MVIGFTGTRGGMTGPQKEVVKQLLVQIIEKHGSGVVVVLHGDSLPGWSSSFLFFSGRRLGQFASSLTGSISLAFWGLVV